MNKGVLELVKRCCDDWCHIADVIDIVVNRLGVKDQQEVQNVSVDIIREALREGLVDIGQLTREMTDFVKWELSIPDAIERVTRDWDALGRTPRQWEVCWLRNTTKGTVLGEALLRSDKE